MSDVQHAQRAHAILSASGADIWINCTPSARLNERIEDKGSVFAEYGTQAHELAEICLKKNLDADEVPGNWDAEQREGVQVYLDYVRAVPGELLVEQRLSFEHLVPQGFGTCDAIVVSDYTMSIIDLKFGVGVKVFAHKAQLRLYALAALHAFDAIYGPIKTIKLVIVQPRLDHIDEFEISADELIAWGNEVVIPAAKLAWAGEGEFSSGDHCTWCKARHDCRARADANLAVARQEMGAWTAPPKAAQLTAEELAEIFPKLDGLVRWANDLEAFMLSQAEAGVKYPGLKVVEGRANRKFADDLEAVKARFESLGIPADKYLNSKVVGITDAEALIGKKKFAEEFADLVVKPAGKPALVVASDKRPEFSTHASAVAEMVG